jgi:ferredoxin
MFRNQRQSVSSIQKVDSHSLTIFINKQGRQMKKEDKKYFSELVDLPELKRLENQPIFYHKEDCDCVTCHARVEKGGLDFDPSNDDEEFEKHEREILAEEEKPHLSIIGKDGNVFNIIGLAIRAGKKAGWDAKRIKKFQEDCFSGDYDHVLNLCMENFEVT